MWSRFEHTLCRSGGKPPGGMPVLFLFVLHSRLLVVVLCSFTRPVVRFFTVCFDSLLGVLNHRFGEWRV